MNDGLCECGCGQTTALATRSDRNGRYAQGEHVRFVVGHRAKLEWRRPMLPRLLARVDKTETCWLWTGVINGHGYGVFGINDGGQGRRLRMAHRLMYEETVGPVPEGLELDHLCRVRRCVNPGHLEPVTHVENVRRGTSPEVHRLMGLAQTHCKWGHEFTPENTYRDPGRGGRHCRTCQNESSRRRRAGVAS